MHRKTKSFRSRAFTRQHGRCCYCGVRMWVVTPEELGTEAARLPGARILKCTAEHLQARQDGGRDAAHNIAAACAHCNHTRHRRRRPLEAQDYAQLVARRLAAGRWHQPWVRALGLLGEQA